MLPEGVTKPPAMPYVVDVELVQDVSGIASPVEGFLRRYRHRAKSRLSDGTRTEPFIADFVDRGPRRRDAVAVALYIPDSEPGRSRVILRQQMRYPVFVACGAALVTEVVAGIIEGDEPPSRAAAREIVEETGLEVPETAIQILGGPFYPSPGVLTELIHVAAAPVPADTLDTPLPAAPTDGSAMEQGARLIALTLEDALTLPAGPPSAGDERVLLCDAKTEIALRRLYETLLNAGTDRNERSA